MKGFLNIMVLELNLKDEGKCVKGRVRGDKLFIGW